MKWIEKLNQFITLLSALALGVMTVLVLLQILFRYVLKIPFPESQELAVYAMVYVVALGSTIAVFHKTHIAVTFIVDKFPEAVRMVVRLIAYAAMLVFFGLLVKYGWDLTVRSMRQSSPSTGIPVGYIVASLPFTSAVSMLYVLAHCVTDIADFRHHKTLS